MKKTLAMLLVLAMVASVCCVMFVSAEETNLLAGKEYEISEQFRAGGAEVGWGYSETAPISYPDTSFELTDGYVPTNDDAYSADSWMAFNQQTPAQKERGYAYVNFDLGEVCSLSELSFTALKDLPTGIQPAYDVEYFVSLDGEEYFSAGKNYLDTDALAALEDKAVHTFKTDVNVSARYIQIRFISYGWNFLGEIEAIGVVGGNAPAPGDDEPALEPAKTWDETMTILENGNAQVEVPYGYTWTIDDINGGIGGEDTTLCDNQDAYNACNPNWAITLYLEKQEDGTYVAIQDAIVTPGSAAGAGITVDEDHVAFVVHSSSSNPDAGYANWEGKVVAMATKAGDVFEIDLDAMTVYAVIPMVEAGPEVVTETITVDGILDDTGWVKADFATADNTNGRWQENYADAGMELPAVVMEYAYRADDNNVYFAVKTNFGANAATEMAEDTGANFDARCETGTRFRLWLDNTPAEGDARSHLIDIMYETSGDEIITGCYLTKVRTTEYTAVITTDGENTYMEACFPKEFFAIGDGFKMAVTYSDVIFGVKADGDAFHNYIYEDNTGAPWSTSAAWPVYNCADIALGTYTVEDEGDNDEDDKDAAREELIAKLEALVGEAIDDPAYTWNLEVALDEETGNVIVTATLSGVDAAQLQCIEGTLHYDAEVLTLLTTADKENALLCLTEPAGSEGEWENMSTLVEDGEIRLGATTFGSATLSDEDPMIFTLEFALAEGTTLTGLYIDTPETYGMNVDADVVNGNGAYGILEIVEEEEPTPSTPSEDESKPSTGAGDAGILVFAILGILAVAGAAVVIKVRN